MGEKFSDQTIAEQRCTKTMNQGELGQFLAFAENEPERTWVKQKKVSVSIFSQLIMKVLKVLGHPRRRGVPAKPHPLPPPDPPPPPSNPSLVGGHMMRWPQGGLSAGKGKSKIVVCPYQ